MRARQVSARLGNVRIDWIAPIGPGGPFSGFLDRHGEGVHHVGVRVPDGATFDREVAAFASAGAGVVARGTPPGSGADVSIESAEPAAEPVGQVVLAAGLPAADRFLVLFEARIDAAGVPWEADGEAQALRIGDSRLARLPLPYAVPAPAPATRPQR